MSHLFGKEEIHHAACRENASLYAVYIDDQITRMGSAVFAVLRRAKSDLEKATTCMIDDVIAMCVIMRCSLTTLINHRITAYKNFFHGGMAGPAEKQLFYLCLQQHSDVQIFDNADLSDAEDRCVDAHAARCLDSMTFDTMKAELDQMRLSFMERLRNLGHLRQWNMTPETFVMGLQCRLSKIHDVLLFLDKGKPLSKQINVSHAFTAVADIAIYLIHLQQFLLNPHPGWTSEGAAYIRPIASRPRPVPNTRPSQE